MLLVIDPEAPLPTLLRAARGVASGPVPLHVAVLDSAARTTGAPRPLPGFLEDLDASSLEPLSDPSEIATLAQRLVGRQVVVGPWPSRSELRRLLALIELASTHDLDVLSVGPRCAAPVTGFVRVGVVLAAGSTALPGVTAALRALPAVAQVTVFVENATVEALERLEPTVRGLLPGLGLELVALHAGVVDLAAVLEREVRARALDLLVVPAAEMSLVRQVAASLATAHALDDLTVPTLLLGRQPEAAGARRLVASDTLRLPGQSSAVTVEQRSLLGRAGLAPDATFTVVGAEAHGGLAHEAGVVRVPEAHLPPGAASLALQAGREVVTVRVVPNAPLVLLDADFPLSQLADVEAFAPDHALVLVRLRADEPLDVLRARFEAAAPWGGPLLVIDASAWLDDAGASDVPRAVDAVRLLRLARRLVASGAQVAALISSDAHAVASDDFVSWTASTLRARNPALPRSRPAPAVEGPEARWRWLTGASLVPGQAATLGLDNRQARLEALAAFARAQERIHFQSYIIEEDATAETFAAALAQAARRGVQVRVLVDALYSLHDTFGVRNRLLERLAAVPGVEVRSTGRLAGIPRLVDLKQRNHRKVLIIDGAFAVLTGRNVGATYYQGYDDSPVTAATPYRDVPWLDAGLALEGPLVASLEQTFRADWQSAGGAAFPVSKAAPCGPLACRLVTHQGLVDAYTLEAQLELVASARERLVLVNNFPLVLELQRALLRALRRGVQVQILFGHVRPRWGNNQYFQGAAYRELADELVRSRFNPLLAAGARGYEHALEVPGLGTVFPHVHAKLYVRDADLVAVGTANLDATSAYWESEALVLVHDEGFARRTLATVEGLIATARPVDLQAPAWQVPERRREWLGRNWPNLVG